MDAASLSLSLPLTLSRSLSSLSHYSLPPFSLSQQAKDRIQAIAEGNRFLQHRQVSIHLSIQLPHSLPPPLPPYPPPPPNPAAASLSFRISLRISPPPFPSFLCLSLPLPSLFLLPTTAPPPPAERDGRNAGGALRAFRVQAFAPASAGGLGQTRAHTPVAATFRGGA